MKTLPSAAAATSGILVGAAIVATRFVIDQTSPAALALLRYAIGFAFLLPLALMGARVRFARRDLPPILLLGIGQFAVVVGLLNYALQFIPSARAALILALAPLLTLLIAAALGHERLSLAKSFGVVLTIVGVGLALGEGALRGAGLAGDWRGEGAVLLSAFCLAVCSVLYRPYVRRYEALPMGALAMFASVAILALAAWGEGFFASLPVFTAWGWFAVVFIGIGSGVGYFLWLWALGRTSATNVTVFLALNPITATGLGILLLGEQVSLTFFVGLACVTAGLWLALRRG